MNLGNYAVLYELGRGASATVFAATGPDGKKVALKVLQGTAPEDFMRFQRERRLQRALGAAEGFVALLDTGDSPLGPFLVMPLLAGGTLSDKTAKGQLGIDETVALGQRIATALGKAHALGIVHRDMKPENILYSEDGQAFIADLGIAKHFRKDVMGASQSVSVSNPDEFFGTAGYMSPEQITGSSPVEAPTDVFALGAILYECLAGRRPFTGPTLMEVLTNVVEGPPPPELRTLRPDVPDWLERVVHGALVRNPHERYPDGAALAKALQPKKGWLPRW